MVGRVEHRVCGSSVGFTRSDDGFFYCDYCNSLADDYLILVLMMMNSAITLPDAIIAPALPTQLLLNQRKLLSILELRL